MTGCDRVRRFRLRLMIARKASKINRFCWFLNAVNSLKNIQIWDSLIRFKHKI